MKAASVTGHRMLVCGLSLSFNLIQWLCWHESEHFAKASKDKLIVEMTSSCKFVFVCVCADLEVYVLNTEADIQDLTFPHSYDSDSILKISALALQQYSNNGL